MNIFKNTMRVLILVIAIIFTSCNKIPNTSISEELSPKDLASAIEDDSTFAQLYKAVRSTYDSMDKVEQAQYFNITYRDLDKFSKFMEDTNYWNPLHEKWRNEWMEKYGSKMQQADSIIQYWKKYKEDNALEKYVNIELARIWTEYYRYSGGIDDVNFGFRITPLKGKVDQLKFKYRFTPKISEGRSSIYDDIMNSHMCICTSPISTPVVRYWEADYTDEKRFGGMTVEQVLRDYDLKIEIREIRYDGRNINEETLGIPESVNDYLKYGFEDFGKGDVVREFIDKEFKERYEYIREESDKICMKKDEACYKFTKKMYRYIE